MKQKLWIAIDRYRLAGGSLEHHAYKADLNALIDEVLAKLVELEAVQTRLDSLINANEKLQAHLNKKMAELEKQKPVAFAWQYDDGEYGESFYDTAHRTEYAHIGTNGRCVALIPAPEVKP